MLHLDLFSGIGGFAYAADQVWDGVEHIFCEVDPFCREVLDKHWPGSVIHGDIRGIKKPIKADLITGGFPCQPFSQAGKRRGTADDRYLWPEMLRVIRLTQPTWIIAENVRGLFTWDEGMVFEQVCTDLEAALYQVQPFIIPAVAVNAPHRRDRIWWVARHTEYAGQHGAKNPQSDTERGNGNSQGSNQLRQPKGTNSLRETSTNTRRTPKRGKSEPERSSTNDPRRDWSANWFEVATEFCRVDDGVPNRVDRIKALGNAIVPQIAVEIMRGINLSLEDTKSGSYTSKRR